MKAAASPKLTAPSLPLSVGTPQSAAKARALALFPNAARVSGVGPTKAMPSASSRAANSAFSLKKP